jgi:hypothetical protein
MAPDLNDPNQSEKEAAGTGHQPLDLLVDTLKAADGELELNRQELLTAGGLDRQVLLAQRKKMQRTRDDLHAAVAREIARLGYRHSAAILRFRAPVKPDETPQ